MPEKPSLRVVQLTPPGRGAVAGLLVEGPGAVRAVAACFRAQSGRPLEQAPADRLVFGRFGPEPAEEVVVRRRADGSVEVNCHGGLAAEEMVCRLLADQGCREVGWGDWVRQRHDDPIAADARLALADARTERTAAILLDQHHGALRREVDAVRGLLGAGQTDAARQRLGALLGWAELGRHLVRPWRVVLAGRPNAGKSSLINALLGYGRAIVHHVPGTTRDVLTATTAIDGWPVELADTAGLVEGGEAIDRAGVARARQQLAAADLVVLVFDLSRPWCQADVALLEAHPGAIIVHSKCDLPAAETSEVLETSEVCSAPIAAAGRQRPEGIQTSARTGVGIAGLVEAIGARLVPAEAPPAGAAVPFTEAQVRGLASAHEALDRGAAAAAAEALEGVWPGRLRRDDPRHKCSG